MKTEVFLSNELLAASKGTTEHENEKGYDSTLMFLFP